MPAPSPRDTSPARSPIDSFRNGTAMNTIPLLGHAAHRTTPTHHAGPATVPAPIRPLRFSTLASVEVRKMTDTRSGRACSA